jgi:hypothetical protein
VLDTGLRDPKEETKPDSSLATIHIIKLNMNPKKKL